MIQVQSYVSVSQLSSRLQESEREAMEKVSDLEKKLIQTTKEVELLKVEYAALLFTFSLLLVKAQLGIFCKALASGGIYYVCLTASSLTVWVSF